MGLERVLAFSFLMACSEQIERCAWLRFYETQYAEPAVLTSYHDVSPFRHRPGFCLH